MCASSEQKAKKAFSREDIIGLGQDSFRKNYYPELREKLMELERINSRNAALISTIPDLLFVSDLKGNIAPFSLSDQQQNGALTEFLTNAKILSLLKQAVEVVVKNHSFHTTEFQWTKDNTVQHYEVRLQMSSLEEILIIIRNMTDRITLEHRLTELADHDSLTNLYNRRCFEEKMNACNGTDQEKICLVSIDVNGLKFINDTLGHLSGDRVIIAAAKIIQNVFEKFGYVARIGGDEFGVILIGWDENQVESMLAQMMADVHAHMFPEKNEILSLAYGYSYHASGIVNMELMFQEADNNMYQNKLLNKESVHSTFVSSFMKALEMKDYVVEGHVVRIERIVRVLGEALSLHRDQMDKLILLAKFHDIGKIGIPDSILKKPAPLTEDEWKVMRTHSSIGERIASEAADIKDIAHLILKHHERWDGFGYPLELKHEEIPIECRILSIADAYDAMTNDRPYRLAMSHDRAIAEIIRCSGKQFDPTLVTLFLKAICGYVKEPLIQDI